MVMENGSPEDEVRINGMFSYAVKHKALKTGRVKTEEYIDNHRLLDSRCCAEGFRDSSSANSPPPTSQLRSLIVFQECISYRKWDFRVAGCFHGVFF